jgi:hypothetical protein
MTSKNGFPWDNISIPQTDLKLIRVDDSHNLDFSWGKDSTGKCLLFLELPSEDAAELKRLKVELKGIKTDFRRLPDSGKMYFQLTLLTLENTDIFYTLCNDLIEKTRTASDHSAALVLIHQRLERWRAFLSKTSKNILTRQEVQGLFAELFFLEECMNKGHVTAHAAVEGWQGPLGAPHDFIFGSEAIEIKSICGSFADGVRISNEGQLTTHLKTLYLHVVFLVQDLECKNGLSLNTLVGKIQDKLAEDVRCTFEGKLFEFGYIDIPDYDRPYFSISRARTYEVSEGFPRLTPDNVPQGVTEVSYLVKFSSIEEFLLKDFTPGGLP